jgi:simple sugar transport system permease protein
MIIGALCSCLFISAMNASGFGEANPQLTVFLAILVAAVAGFLYSMLLAFASIKLKADQTIGGTALNMLAPAVAIVLTWAIQGQGQTTIRIPNWLRIEQVDLGLPAGSDFLSTLIFKSLYLTTPLAILLLILSSVFLYKTRTGLRLRACGEHPHAADSVGINVYRMRYLGVGISGILGGIGGLAYTVAAGSGFESSVAGYGFLALAVMIFGNWKPLNILGASLFFALFKIIGSYANSLPFLPRFETIKSSEYIYLMLPYIVTMIVLILTSKKSRAPKAEGIPYDQGGR